jgi:hypothetical protein
LNTLLDKLGTSIQVADRRAARRQNAVMIVIVTVILALVIIANAHALGI